MAVHVQDKLEGLIAQDARIFFISHHNYPAAPEDGRRERSVRGVRVIDQSRKPGKKRMEEPSKVMRKRLNVFYGKEERKEGKRKKRRKESAVHFSRKAIAFASFEAAEVP